jgi:hypothetical protein
MEGAPAAAAGPRRTGASRCKEGRRLVSLWGGTGGIRAGRAMEGRAKEEGKYLNAMRGEAGKGKDRARGESAAFLFAPISVAKPVDQPGPPPSP